MISPNHLAISLVKIITGRKFYRPKAVEIHNKDLARKGDLSFHLELHHWRDYIDAHSDCYKNSENILQYFMHSCLASDSTLSDDVILEELKERLAKKLKMDSQVFNQWVQMIISDKFVLIKFNRSNMLYDSIKTAIEKNLEYAAANEMQACRKKYNFIVDSDFDSDVTTMRLELLKRITTNLLKFNGHDVQDKECDNNFIFTIKSESKIAENNNKCLCGAVLDENKKKIKHLTKEGYLQQKVEKIRKLNTERILDFRLNQKSIEEDIFKLARASVNYELLSIKHITPLVLEGSDRTIKEASFVLYNYVRITAILDKHKKLVLENEFPQIFPIEKMESFTEIIDEESWLLVYNYIIKYPDVLKSVVTIEPKLEVNIQLLWLFLTNLCHNFSKYYRKNRILMKGFTSNQFSKAVSEKLYMLKALKIVLQNALSLLNIEEVLYM